MTPSASPYRTVPYGGGRSHRVFLCTVTLRAYAYWTGAVLYRTVHVLDVQCGAVLLAVLVFIYRSCASDGLQHPSSLHHSIAVS